MVNIQGDQRILIAEQKRKKKEGLIAFLDIDGVCSFWEKSAGKTCGIDIEDKEIREAIKNGKRFESFVGGDEKMWPIIDKEGSKWWADMELLPWAKRLFDELNKRADHFSFLSSPSNSPHCAAGKIEWLKKHFGDDFKDFLIGRNKHLCASPRSLLVDDDKKKIKKFRKFGGHAFQWPSPFHLLDGDVDIEDTFNDLFEYINEIRN